jgi:hypothetical protein
VGGLEFSKLVASMGAATIAAARGGHVFVSVVQYPDGVGGGMVRAAFTTHTAALANALGSIQDSISKPVTDALGGADELYESACAEDGADVEAAKEVYNTARWHALCHAAEMLALRNVLHAVFGLSKKPHLPTLAAAASKAPGAAAPAPAIPGLPSFLKGKVMQKLWGKAWGLGCFQQMALTREEMVRIVQRLCASYEQGALVMFNKKKAAAWKESVVEQKPVERGRMAGKAKAAKRLKRIAKYEKLRTQKLIHKNLRQAAAALLSPLDGPVQPSTHPAERAQRPEALQGSGEEEDSDGEGVHSAAGMLAALT